MLNVKKMLTKITNTPLVVESGYGEVSYRKWSDGTLEQWGIASITASSGNASSTISFATPFVNTDYTVLLTGGYNATSVVTLAENNHTNANRERTTSSFKVSAYKSGYAYYIGFSFYVIGRWK